MYKTKLIDFEYSCILPRGFDIANHLCEYNGVNDKVHVGAIAEELDSMGLKEYVKYDELGRPDGIYYQSLVTPLIQLVKDLTNNLEEIDKRIQKLENLSKN